MLAAPSDCRADYRWPLRVYYEDTDAGGIVYYANFLKFFERCRTEWLRELGYQQVHLAAQDALQFVVTELAVRYLKPARLDDELEVYARLARAGAASLQFEQRLLRAGELLATAQVKIACVSAQSLAPTPLPHDLRRRLSALHPDARAPRPR
jgi:acyl-CoA thioester hydrolase